MRKLNKKTTILTLMIMDFFTHHYPALMLLHTLLNLNSHRRLLPLSLSAVFKNTLRLFAPTLILRVVEDSFVRSYDHMTPN